VIKSLNKSLQSKIRRKYFSIIGGGPEAEFRNMMRNIKTTNKQFLDAIRFKTILRTERF
jgi:hypothetical protein